MKINAIFVDFVNLLLLRKSGAAAAGLLVIQWSAELGFMSSNY